MTLARTVVFAQIPGVLIAQPHPPPTRTEIAPGIHLFQTARYSDVGLDGNSVVIVGANGVLVFDANGTPAAAAAVLAEIRKLTTAPVRWLVLSHWHWDHWYGAQVYADAFPGVQIIGHEASRRLMQGPFLEFNRPFMETQLPGHIAGVAARVARTRDSAPASPDLARMEGHLQADRFFLEQKSTTRHTPPNLTYHDSLTIHVGDRAVKVLHYDRAVTPGDSFLHLPAERIVITGDLLIKPMAFALSCYPTGWLRTLERIRALTPAVLIPGHGEPLRDGTLLDAHIDAFRIVLEQGKAAKARGLDVEQARAAMMPALAGPMQVMTGGDASLQQSFGIYIVDWYLHRVYDELDGKLTDAIAPIPNH